MDNETKNKLLEKAEEKKKLKLTKYYETDTYDKKGRIIDRHWTKSYPPKEYMEGMLKWLDGSKCQVHEQYKLEKVKEPFLKVSDIVMDEDKWLYYKIWNPDRDQKKYPPYESCVEYPYNRMGVIAIVKIAAYCGLQVVFHSVREDIAHWANWYAWEYDCSPLDFSDEEREQDEDDDLFF